MIAMSRQVVNADKPHRWKIAGRKILRRRLTISTNGLSSLRLRRFE
jgi:hypothetical protein